MDLRKLPLCCVVLLARICTAQNFTVPAGTPFPVQIEDHLPMRLGQTITAELIYPIYVDNTEVLPAKTLVSGTVVSMHANHSGRITARLRGDFTPFKTPVVRFTGITLADGTTIPLVAGVASDGAPIYRLVAPPPRKGGFLHQQWDNGVQILKDKLTIVTGPGRGDRMTQFLYTQLPYHPQRIEKMTAWTVETSEPLYLSPRVADMVTKTKPAALAVVSPQVDSKTWIIQAYVSDALSSAMSKPGETIKATVAEPIYNEDHTIAVPQSATIVGAVTRATPARSFGRGGTLHFDFRQLILPGGNAQNVQASLIGADSAAPAKLALDSEG
jgi:hypothetical protein